MRQLRDDYCYLSDVKIRLRVKSKERHVPFSFVARVGMSREGRQGESLACGLALLSDKY